MKLSGCEAVTRRSPATVDGSQAIKLLKFVSVFGFGGTERQFVNLSLALNPSRFALCFGCLRQWGHFLETVEARGIPVFEYQVKTFRNPRVVAAQLRLARDIRRYGIQIVHTYNFYANTFAVPAARLAGARVVASIRDMGPYLSPSQRRVQRCVCRLADKILVNAKAIKDWLVDDGYNPERISIIPNGVEVARFNRQLRPDKLHRELALSPDAPLIGVVSRVTRLKGIEDFLKAAAIVGARFPTARFLILGDGLTPQGSTIARDLRYRRELTDLVEHLGLHDRVVFTGFRADINEVLPELAVSVSPSLSEGLSNAVLESMAAGVPVVATGVGGTPEAVKDGETGLLVPPCESGSLASAICRLLSEPALAERLGQAGRRRVSERFSMTQMVDATSRLYESLVSPPSRRCLPRFVHASVPLVCTPRDQQ